MKVDAGIAYLELEIAKVAKTHSPIVDRTFVMGMIEMAEHCELIDQRKANQYRDDLDAVFIKRNNHLKGVAA
ncbi:hypothetical protein QN382_19950 [Pseudomonas sp. 10B1]|uniref:hypothetical protein n=1 Tax=unclassified Pseudomonas TaxID=196821 RepID=UPI002B224B9A|nr:MULTISPECIES: hypothetical protein [unclassified Pseudomonas]MEA9994577.1 hypothetical protein [Pseudomonas sp. AA4]MEB0085722.1 hypothetical protein [Pseudomonas sp. RTI1]MEB0125953.1 hypothetical protein [Pseudomonas sp. CCC1.2]MEB0152757.1 hypothetical protein [Pseudomonas sp. CCC4.3]MEB0221262.1 hypothetical protein [Pseudomonas sp. AB12(2023)]